MKHVERTLANVWVRHMSQSHLAVLQRGLASTTSSSLSLPPQQQFQLQQLFKTSHLLRQEMQSFIVNLTSFMMYEVLECAWDSLVSSVSRCVDLDDIIGAHQVYLQQIVDKALLGGSEFPLHSQVYSSYKAPNGMFCT